MKKEIEPGLYRVLVRMMAKHKFPDSMYNYGIGYLKPNLNMILAPKLYLNPKSTYNNSPKPINKGHYFTYFWGPGKPYTSNHVALAFCTKHPAFCIEGLVVRRFRFDVLEIEWASPEKQWFKMI